MHTSQAINANLPKWMDCMPQWDSGFLKCRVRRCRRALALRQPQTLTQAEPPRIPCLQFSGEFLFMERRGGYRNNFLECKVVDIQHVLNQERRNRGIPEVANSTALLGCYSGSYAGSWPHGRIKTALILKAGYAIVALLR